MILPRVSSARVAGTGAGRVLVVLSLRQRSVHGCLDNFDPERLLEREDVADPLEFCGSLAERLDVR